jgi:hypothetical protein
MIIIIIIICEVEKPPVGIPPPEALGREMRGGER